METNITCYNQLPLKAKMTHHCHSVAKPCPTLWDPMDCSTPGFPVLHCAPEFAKIHVHWVGDAVQLYHPLLPPFPPALNLPASGSLPMSQIFRSGGQSTGDSALASVLPMNIQGWFPLGLTGFISFLSKELSRVFSSNTVWKQLFFSAQSSLRSNSHIHTWPLEKP